MKFQTVVLSYKEEQNLVMLHSPNQAHDGNN